MKAGVLPYQIDDGNTCTVGVMQIRESVGQTWPEMEQRACWLLHHARVPIRCTRYYSFEKAENTSHPRDLIEGGNDVDLGCAGI
jgi:hypothetical protein